MYKPDENDIDRISRDAAERYNAPGAPSWDKLRQTLDKELPQEKEKKRRGFFFFLFLLLGLLLAGSVVWYSTSTNKTTAIAEHASTKTKDISKENTASNTSSPVLKAKNSTKEVPVNAAAIPIPEKNIPATSNSAVEPALNSKNNNATVIASIVPPDKIKTTTVSNPTKNKSGFRTAEPVIARIKTAKPLRTTVTVQHKNQQPDLLAANTAEVHGAQKKNTRGQKQSATKNLPAVADHNTVGDVAANSTVVSGNNTKGNTDDITSKNNEPIAVAATADTMNNKSTVAKDLAADKPAATENKDAAKTTAPTKKKNKAKNDKAILLGLTAGLDQSTVKFTYNSGLGYNIGFMGGYQFSKHWSVYTGLVYTKKNYKLNGTDFHPPKHYWTQYVNLETVEGYCRMWELPLQARYTFNPSARMPFFASAGLSSYFMKKQGYDYYYKTNAGMPGSGNWSTDSSFNHVMSILSLSAGFQKMLGKHMNWQIEPYAKIPLGGVGFGNIKLSSFGVNLSVQYKKSLKASSKIPVR